MTKWVKVAVQAGIAAIVMSSMAVAVEDLPSLRAENDQGIREVVTGARATASAAWWGFNEEDATDALQSAFDSPAKTVVVPYMGTPWIVRPLKLHGNQEIVFEPGVLVLAKKGEFRGGGDSLLSAGDVENLTLRGYGATLRMRKKDYQNSPYTKAEWRMGIGLRGCVNVVIEGLRIESSGGDGIYIDGGVNRKWSENITIRNVACYDNHRQGISVISAQNLLIENSSLSATRGTAPEAGIDFEPDSPEQRLVNCVVRNCLFENNAGNASLVYLKQLSRESEPVSVRFENCVSRMGDAGDAPDVVRSLHLDGWGGMTVGACKDDGPQGIIEFNNCVSENTGREGARVYDKSAEGVKVRFVNCSWKNAWLAEPLDYDGPRSPISVILRRPELTTRLGGIEFVDCHVYDTEDRPALVVYEEKGHYGVRNLTGKITVHNAHGAGMDLGDMPSDLSPGPLEVLRD
jgi:hypothetical protein